MLIMVPITTANTIKADAADGKSLRRRPGLLNKHIQPACLCLDSGGGPYYMITTPSRNIMIHAINFAPELIGCGKYTTELAQYLASRGHLVSVVTAPPHYPGWAVREPYNALAYREDALDSIRIMRCPILTKANGRGIWRMLPPLSFALGAAPIVAWQILRSKPDAVLCVEPTLFSAPVVAIMCKLMGIRSVLHVQDLEVDAAFEVGHIKGGAFRKVALSFERAVLKGFDSIITISSSMRNALIAKGLDPYRVAVVRNWIDTQTVVPFPRSIRNPFRKKLDIAETQFVVLYAGHIGEKQALHVLLAAARHLKEHHDISFVIAGEGPLKQRFMEENYDLDNVSYLPLQPVERLSELLGMADLHVLPQHKAAADLVLPSKLGGMLASGRPIVATVDAGTELFEMLKDIALLTPAGDSRALSEAICRARAKDLSGQICRGLGLAEALGSFRLLPKFERELLGIR
jgi:colanic acid biosynthesis glycosyl transferase WcaI